MSQKHIGQIITLLPIHLFLFIYPISVVCLSNLTPVVAQSSPAVVKKGYQLLKKGWVNDAISAFEQALKKYPQSLDAKLGLAIAYNRAGRIEDAWSTYQQVLELDPDNESALKIIGMMGTYRPEWNQLGITALDRLLSINSNDLQARYYRALLNSYQGNFSESLADYQIVLASNPTPEAILGAAQTYSYTGNFENALELFNRYRATGEPITGYAAVAYASTLRETGNPLESKKLLEAQLHSSDTLDQLAILTRSELAKTYLATEEEAEAIAVLEPLQGNGDAILPLARSLNEIRKQTQNPKLAPQVANLYRQALTNDPNPTISLLREAADVFSGLPEGGQTALQLYRQLASQLPDDQSLLVRQLGLETKLGLLTQNELTQRLVVILQSLPRDAMQLKQLAVALADLDAPDPQLLPYYQTILQTGADVPFLNFRVAQMYVQLEDTKNARLALAAYSATSPGAKDMAPQLLAAEIERREGNLEASAQRYQAILANNSDEDITNGALRGLVGVKVQQQQFDEALKIYDQLLAREPQNVLNQLGRTSVAYQAKSITQPQAEAVLNTWLATQKATNTPPELYSLVGQLPADPQREPLYNYLVKVNSSDIRIQERLLEAIAQRNPAAARKRMKQLIANLPKDSSSDKLQARLARAVGDLNLAGQAYENILSQEPDNIDALAALGGIRFQQRRFEAAEQIYSRVLEDNPDDIQARRALAGLNAIFDKPLAAMAALEQIQLEQIANGEVDSKIGSQMQLLQEDFLLRRGFQPPWESYERRNN